MKPFELFYKQGQNFQGDPGENRPAQITTQEKEIAIADFQRWIALFALQQKRLPKPEEVWVSAFVTGISNAGTNFGRAEADQAKTE